MTATISRPFSAPAHKLAQYRAGNGTCGDLLSSAISAYVVGPDGKVSVRRINQLCSDNGISPKPGANVGQYRMNASNMLRARHRRGERVVVGDRTL